MNTIQEEWQAFQRHVMPVSAPVIQRQEMEKAFYAGAMSVLNVLTGPVPEMSENAAVAVLQALIEEAHAYFRGGTS